MANTNFREEAQNYLSKLRDCMTDTVMESSEELGKILLKAWKRGKSVYICGNGGSAANAIHIANDLHYGVGACGDGEKVTGLKVEALCANIGIMTCLANDTGYENIYEYQIAGKGNKEDVLIALSGSGNSENIINALERANKIGMETVAIVGFDGGKAKDIAKRHIHLKINDMQIAEDTQLIIAHMCMQWLGKNKPGDL